MLEPFNEASRCPKCGHDNIAVHWRPHADRDSCWYDRKYHKRYPDQELIERICRRCNFSWPQSIITNPATDTSEKGKTDA